MEDEFSYGPNINIFEWPQTQFDSLLFIRGKIDMHGFGQTSAPRLAVGRPHLFVKLKRLMSGLQPTAFEMLTCPVVAPWALSSSVLQFLLDCHLRPEEE